jgi:hypothetical protein
VHIAVISVTFLLLAAGVYAFVHSYQRTHAEQRRKALQICEDGLMVALHHLGESPSWRDGIPRTEHADGSYEVQVTVVEGAVPARIEIAAHGLSGKARRTQTCVLELSSSNGDSVWVQSSIREQ